MIFRSYRRPAGLGISLLLLAGCNGSQPQTTPSLPTTGGPATHSSALFAEMHSPDLVYAANRKDGSVGVYVLSNGKLQAKLSNVRASGMCANGDGSVFITSGSDVFEYVHGGTRPVAVLHGALGAALQSCAADRTTGDLAVANGAGRIAVYADAKGNPRPLADGRAYTGVAYDDSADLFAASGRVIRELPAGSTQLRDVVWSGTRPAHIGTIQWDGQYLAVENKPATQSAVPTVSRYAVSGNRLTFVDSMPLQGTTAPLQFAVFGAKLVAPAANGIAVYSYPEGGRGLSLLQDALAPQFVAISRAGSTKFAVTTYHDDNYRTGWNDDESTLTYKTVKSGSFGLLANVTLDDQVDAQPLVVPNVLTTAGTTPGLHDVVYVVTENDSVYAIDASSGQVLIKQNLGTPVKTPLGCTNNGPNVGITGTPVVDAANNVMYVITYAMESKVPTYRIHELSLSDLTDAVPSVIVAASHALTNGKTFTFDATYERQRPALLEANGNVYAGFGSFCDYDASNSRGWLLGWQAGTLTPLSANRLNNSLSTSPNQFFLSSIWMSGYGLATDASGNIYFVTGNSDYSGNTYNGVTNVNESVVKVSSDLTTLLSIFTPSNVSYLDEVDEDFGSGGVLVLPTLSSNATPLAAAAGKDGNMYVMDQNSLGGYGSSDHVVTQQYIGGCWCGQSYFAHKKRQRIVSSGGNTVMVWDVKGAKNAQKTKLSLMAESPGLPSGQDGGFFTSVSSNHKGGDAIIWALARPQYPPASMALYALAAQPAQGSSQLKTLYQSSSAGYWAAANGNANLVPVVANGKVYVASYEELTIFGLGGKKNAAAARHGAHLAYRTFGRDRAIGTLESIRGSLLTLKSTAGTVLVDDTVAVKNQRTGDLVRGEPFIAWGRYDGHHVLQAATIIRAKPSGATSPTR